MDEEKLNKLIEEKLGALEQKMSATVNAAVTGHIKRSNEKNEKSIADLTAMMTKLVERGDESPAPAPAAAAPAPAGHAAPHATSADPAIIALQNKIAENDRLMKQLQEQAKQKEEAAQKADAARRDVEARTNLAAALRAKGVREELVEPAVSYLYVDKKTVTYDDDGALVFWHKGEYGPEARTVEKGTEGWLAGEGKHYLPPRQTGGTGATGGSVSPARAKAGEVDIMQELAKFAIRAGE